MSSIGCSFCQHANPASAKFCNECGAVLRLQPCPRCDAVNDRDAARCHQCDAALSASAAADAAGLDRLADKPAAETESSVARALESIEADLASLSVRRAPAPSEPLAAVRLHPFWRTPGISMRRGVVLAALLVVASSAAVIGYQRGASPPPVELLASQRLETGGPEPVPASALPEDPKPATLTAAPASGPDKGIEASAKAAAVAQEPAVAAADDAGAAVAPAVNAETTAGSPAVTASPVAESSPAVTASPVADASPAVAASPVAEGSPAVTAGPAGAGDDATRSMPPRNAARGAKTRARNARGGEYSAMRTREPAPPFASGTDALPPRIRGGDCTSGVAALGLCTAADASNGR